MQEYSTHPFYDYHWHDANIKMIRMNRYDPGNVDTIEFDVEWPDSTSNTLIFNDVFWAKFDMNFSITAHESTHHVEVLDNADADVAFILGEKKWQIDPSLLTAYLIETNSTGSKIKIIAMNLEMIAKQ